MERLFHDFETASCCDLEVRGLDNYSKDPSTRVNLLSWALDSGPVQLWEPLRGQSLPEIVREAVLDPFVTKVAWNGGSFERQIWLRVLGIDIPLDEWYDPMIHARMLSMPGKLKDVGEIIKLPQNLTKLDGSDLVTFFGEPAMKARDTLFGHQDAQFRDHITHPKEWEEYAGYCVRDTETLRGAVDFMSSYPIPNWLTREWITSQICNERGMPVRLSLAVGTSKVDDAIKAELIAELQELTGLVKPTGRDKFLAWARKLGYPFNSLGKQFVARAFGPEGDSMTPTCRLALTKRVQVVKTAGAKSQALKNLIGSDGFLRHQYSFLGAVRTGRDAGGGGESKSVQAQNMPRPTKLFEKNQDLALELLEKGDYEAIKKHFENPIEIVGSSQRCAFQAPPGFDIVVSDINAVENRGVGWLAKCEAIMKIHREGRCPYLDFAVRWMGGTYQEISLAFKSYEAAKRDKLVIPPEGLQAAEKRTLSKPSTLGCAYRLSGGEEKKNDDGDVMWTGLLGYARAMGVILTPEQAEESVAVFRKQFKEVTKAWKLLEEASFSAVENPGRSYDCCRCTFEAFGTRMLRITLPSGRGLHYIRPRIRPNERFGGRQLVYEGKDQKSKFWTQIETHGGKTIEQVTQGTCRDFFYHGFMRAEASGLPVWLRNHDELGCLVPEDDLDALPRLERCMAEVPDWAPGMLLAAKGYRAKIYRKD